MFGIIAVSLSVLVILAGLSMLAKSKKESLGKLYTFSSYAAIFIGLGLFIGGNIGGIKRLCHANGGACSSSYSGQDGASSCASFSGHQSSKCGSHASFGHGSSCPHQGGGQSCSSKGGHVSCGHGKAGHSGCGHGEKKHKACKKYAHHGESGEHIDVNIEIEESDDDDDDDDDNE